MTLVFGRDVICVSCHHIHAVGASCQPSIVAGEAEKQKGIQLVIRNETSDWPARAERWVLSLRPGAVFTAETLCKEIGRPERPNSVGARLSLMARNGWIKRVGFVEATRPSRHANVNREWERT